MEDLRTPPLPSIPIEPVHLNLLSSLSGQQEELQRESPRFKRCISAVDISNAEVDFHESPTKKQCTPDKLESDLPTLAAVSPIRPLQIEAQRESVLLPPVPPCSSPVASSSHEATVHELQDQVKSLQMLKSRLEREVRRKQMKPLLSC